jgi:hypothetical protein
VGETPNLAARLEQISDAFACLPRLRLRSALQLWVKALLTRVLPIMALVFGCARGSWMAMLTVFGCRSNLANSDETLVASSVLMKLLAQEHF